MKTENCPICGTKNLSAKFREKCAVFHVTPALIEIAQSILDEEVDGLDRSGWRVEAARAALGEMDLLANTETDEKPQNCR